MFLTYNADELGDKLATFFGVLIGLAVITTIVYLIVSAQKNRTNATQPIKSCYAKVLDAPQGTGVRSMSYVAILFELESGNRIRFIVKATHDWVAGDYGKITWQGDQLISFVRITKPTEELHATPKPKEAVPETVRKPKPLPELPIEESAIQPEMNPNDDRVFCPKCGTRQPYRTGVCVRCNSKLVKPE